MPQQLLLARSLLLLVVPAQSVRLQVAKLLNQRLGVGQLLTGYKWQSGSIFRQFWWSIDEHPSARQNQSKQGGQLANILQICPVNPEPKLAEAPRGNCF
jgi:hypothetical protein